MALLTKASVLWVILKQSRRFSIGEMDILAEFTYMHTVLSSKSSAYSHAETPTQLYRHPKEDKIKEKRKLGNLDTNGDKRHKPVPPPQARANPNSWHPKLRAKLESQMRATSFPSFSAIMKFCGTDPEGVYPRWHKKCSPNAFFGRCHKGSECTKNHNLPSDVEVEKIIELTKKFQANHLDILKGQ